ncbi:MAG TPA: alpha/beta fold hydrolase [Rhodanobacteraceae bacterium]|nr:alpha/beta fold hydrolase [Rhodanobacteraceae bacterium]
MSAETLSAPPATSAAFDTGWLDAGHGHRVYYEQAGAPDGIPAVLLHGGPGSGSTVRQREILDAARYRIVQFDQRGSGRSTPAGGTAHNHTDALIGDIEALREQLGIERWLVCGGSWGAALALAYAARHRERVAGVLLRGTFLTSREDLDWFFHGAGALFPEAHAAFIAHVPRRWQRSVVAWLDRCFSRDDPRAAGIAAAWQAYELRLMGDRSPPTGAPGEEASKGLVAKYRVQAHYLARRCFLGERAVLRAASALRGVPVAIVHGEEDRICRPVNAWRVHRACPGSRLAWAVGAGHSPFHPAMLALTRGATDAFASAGDFSAWPP